MSLKKSETFKKRWNDLLKNFQDNSDEEVFEQRQAFLLRLRRAISWLSRAEQVKGENVKETSKDIDTQFIFLWIGFNAVYARVPEEFTTGDSGPPERDVFKAYFQTLVDIDKENRIYNAVWERFYPKDSPHPKWIENKYVFAPFWDAAHGKIGREEWSSVFARSKRRFKYARKNTRTAPLLAEVFDRLYVLRNQLMHGGATWNSKVNREQVRDGAKIMSWLLPIFIDLMLENPEKDWGEVFYPRVEGVPLEPF